MDIDPSPFLTVAGPWAAAGTVVMTVVMSLVRGLLIPWKTHERELKIRDDLIILANSRADLYEGKYNDLVRELVGMTETVADRATVAKITRQIQRYRTEPEVTP